MSEYYEVIHSNVFNAGEDPVELLQDIYKVEYKGNEQSYSKGDLIPYHTHSHSECLVILNGSVRVIIEEDIIDLFPGDIITIEPWAIHMCAFPKGAAHFYVCFPRAKK